MSYVALLPAYDFGNWVPTIILNSYGVPSLWVEMLVNQADKLAHTFGAMVISLLYYSSLSYSAVRQVNPLRFSAKVFLSLLFSLALSAELMQLWIGRNFSFSDIFAGMLGGGLALVLIKASKPKTILLEKI